MSKVLTVIPAYGRDYQTEAQAMEAWREENDFFILDGPYRGSYLSSADVDRAVKDGVRFINIRYRNTSKVAVINLEA